MKKAFCLLFAALMALSLAGCTPMQSISHVELNMQVPADMVDVNQTEDIKGYGFIFAMENEQFFICGLRQDLSDFENGKSTTIEEYTSQLVTEYGIADRVTYGERKSKGYVYLRFNMALESGMSEYLCGIFKSSGAFWLIQINTTAEKFDETKFLQYLDTVNFSPLD